MGTHQPQPGSFIKDFLAGGISTAVAETVMAPLERIKMILQVQTISRQIKKEERYKGLTDALRRIPREQGIYSLWRGNLISIVRFGIVQAFNFALKDKLEYYFLRNIDVHSHHKKLAIANLSAGGIAGGLASSIIYPLNLAQTRIATDVGAGPGASKHKLMKKRQFTGTIDCLRQISRSNGFRGLYEGSRVTIVGMFIYRACYFGIYDTMKVILAESPHPEDTPLLQKWLMAQTSVVIAGLISFPLESLGRRMMMQVGLPTDEKKYKNVKDCIRKTLSEEGIAALFSGGLTNILKSTGGAIVLVIYDEIKPLYLQMDSK